MILTENKAQSMDITFYQILKQQLTEPPDLSIIQSKHPLPENWPVLLHSIQTFRKQMNSFTISDGNKTVLCVSTLPEVYEKVTSMELGTIIHLMGADTVYDNDRRAYILDVHSVFTLKEYDDHLKFQQKKEMERLALLREQDYLENVGQDLQSTWGN